MSNLLELFIQARAKIVRGFCQGSLAQGPYREDLSPRDARAETFCSLGAICAVSGVGIAEGLGAAMVKHLRRHGGYAELDVPLSPEQVIYTYNDSHGKEDVLARFDQAIAALEAPVHV